MSTEVPSADLKSYPAMLVANDRPDKSEERESIEREGQRDSDQPVSYAAVFAQCVAVMVLAIVGWSFLSLFGEPGEAGGRRMAVILGYAMVGTLCVVYGVGLVQPAEATESNEPKEL